MLRHITKHEPPAWLLVIAIIFFLTIIGLSTAAWSFNSLYSNKILPGVSFNRLELGGKTNQEAFALISQAIDHYRQEAITFDYQGQKTNLPLEYGGYSDFTSNLVNFDIEKMTENALNYGKDKGVIANLAEQIKLVVRGQELRPIYSINEQGIKDFLLKSFKNLNQTSQSASLKYENDRLYIENEKNGYKPDFKSSIKEIDSLLSSLRSGEIKLITEEDRPLITAEKLKPLISQAENQLITSPLILHYGKDKWTIEKKLLGNWLTIDNSFRLSLKKEEIEKYLKDTPAKIIEIEVGSARFAIKNGRAAVFSPAQDGLAIDINTTIANIEHDWLINRISSSSIATIKLPSNSSSSDALSLGIKEIIGIGTSNFSGSSANRRHNIKIGMNSLSGLLVPPGETFSVMHNLGTIDGSKGYLEELVIKGDKTQKEFGGGLCQIGTTVFRAALKSGLPIVERRNHSYRVSYYEPAGTDATIYDPSPDLKFLNDTGHHILIQAYMKGNDLSFEFWGTKDGRQINQTYPKITNIVKPRPTKLIETISLKPGEKKCTEKAHNGADASFTYSVAYPDGQTKTKIFNSHYVPWQEVCLIGVKTLSASSTPVRTASSSQEKAIDTTSAIQSTTTGSQEIMLKIPANATTTD